MVDLKHVGRVKASNKKCIVAYRTLPGDAYNCLIILTEHLPDSQHDALISLVESNAGQASGEFAEALMRTNFPDGSIMLAALHTQGKLVKVSTDQIEMLPNMHTSILLSELNQLIAEQRGVPVDALAIQPSKMEEAAKAKEVASIHEQPSPVDEPATVEPTSFESPDDEAKYYRSQADKLAKEAAKFRRMAEELVPTKKAK